MNRNVQEQLRNHAPLFATARGDIRVSFEFFPPKTEKMEATLWDSIKTLEPLGPRFVSVTYGAGGSTRERTHNTVVRIQRETTLHAAAHLTCVEATRGEIDDIARAYWDAGIRHIVALRGDPPQGEARYTPHPDGYANAAELVRGLKRIADFETPTDGHTMVNASLAWHPWGKTSETVVMLSANNIFDVEARRHASFTKDFVPMAGRDIRLSTRFSF